MFFGRMLLTSTGVSYIRKSVSHFLPALVPRFPCSFQPSFARAGHSIASRQRLGHQLIQERSNFCIRIHDNHHILLGSQGEHSPQMSGEKVRYHKRTTRGWMCTTCDLVHEDMHLFYLSKCKTGDNLHSPAPAEIDCKECQSPGKNTESRLLEVRKQLHYANEYKELRRLELLKKVEDERRQLAKLMQMKFTQFLANK